MNKKILVLVLFALITNYTLQSKNIPRDKKYIEAVRAEGTLKIDGRLNENLWTYASVATDFSTYSPTIGAIPVQQTEVRILYDDDALYIGAMLYDDSEDLILRELSLRDGHGANTDIFWVTLNPFNDGQNIFRFEVSAANVQTDIKISQSGQDRNWNAVWESNVQIADNGWSVEMRIPYSAIRFTKDEVQNWSVNFWRLIRREKEISSWNPVDRSIGSDDIQSGEIINLRDIDTPLRLELYPYVSAYVGKSGESTGIAKSINGGLDLKYGLNESFSLDMTLIPDFGQTASDQQVLNLGPYETYYSENREFFKEGTELFNKAGLFYSRRIGQTPKDYNAIEENLETGEFIVENPMETQMINATKISGRTSSNLGIGIFNAMMKKSEAIIANGEGEERFIETNPFTNYNMLVFDQIIGNASFINFTNTNVYQPSAKKIADVLGTSYKFTDQSVQYALWGNAANSFVSDSTSSKPENGQSLAVRAGKINGQFRFNGGLNLTTDTYDPSDMGYIRKNNYLNYSVDINYGKYQPTKYFQNWNVYLNTDYNQMYLPKAFTSFSISSGFRVTTMNFISLGLRSWVIPFGSHNYDETRTIERYINIPKEGNVELWISSDYRKKFALDGNIQMYSGKGNKYRIRIAPRLRINDQFSLATSFELTNHLNDNGYITTLNDSIVFGDRNRKTVVNNISTTYVFSNKSALSLNLRHYWAAVDYYDFYLLNEQSNLSYFSDYTENYDVNFNTVNIDFTYSWNFAPGSFMSVMWKNSILDSETIEDNNFLDFNENLIQTFSGNSNNVISLKITYFIDYQTIKKHI